MQNKIFESSSLLLSRNIWWRTGVRLDSVARRPSKKSEKRTSVGDRKFAPSFASRSKSQNRKMTFTFRNDPALDLGPAVGSSNDLLRHVFEINAHDHYTVLLQLHHGLFLLEGPLNEGRDLGSISAELSVPTQILPMCLLYIAIILLVRNFNVSLTS